MCVGKYTLFSGIFTHAGCFGSLPGDFAFFQQSFPYLSAFLRRVENRDNQLMPGGGGMLSKGITAMRAAHIPVDRKQIRGYDPLCHCGHDRALLARVSVQRRWGGGWHRNSRFRAAARGRKPQSGLTAGPAILRIAQKNSATRSLRFGPPAGAGTFGLALVVFGDRLRD